MKQNNKRTKLNEVLETRVAGRSIERYLADVLAEAEKKDLDIEKVKLQNSVIKQWNSHHREVNASYRIELRDREALIETQKMALKQMELSQF